MPRITYHTPDSDLAWFERDKATLVATDETEWDGNNHISRATRSQWIREDLYRTAGGAWVILRDNHDTRTVPPGPTWHGITPDEAQAWLRKQDLHELADTEFEAVEERGPGRPEIGERICVRLPPALLADVDRIAAESGSTRPDVIRIALSEWIFQVAVARGRRESPKRP